MYRDGWSCQIARPVQWWRRGGGVTAFAMFAKRNKWNIAFNTCSVNGRHPFKTNWCLTSDLIFEMFDDILISDVGLGIFGIRLVGLCAATGSLAPRAFGIRPLLYLKPLTTTSIILAMSNVCRASSWFTWVNIIGLMHGDEVNSANYWPIVTSLSSEGEDQNQRYCPKRSWGR